MRLYIFRFEGLLLTNTIYGYMDPANQPTTPWSMILPQAFFFSKKHAPGLLEHVSYGFCQCPFYQKYTWYQTFELRDSVVAPRDPHQVPSSKNKEGTWWLRKRERTNWNNQKSVNMSQHPTLEVDQLIYRIYTHYYWYKFVLR